MYKRALSDGGSPIYGFTDDRYEFHEKYTLYVDFRSSKNHLFSILGIERSILVLELAAYWAPNT